MSISFFIKATKKANINVMIRSLLIVAMILIIGFTCAATGVAGDVPESLLHSDEALVFFGEVKEVETDKIVVVVTENIKGTAEVGGEYEYDEWAFTQEPEIGQIYLCGYLDENNPLDVWQITGTNTETVEINHPDDMSQRMEKYLNDGDFAEAQAKLMEKKRTEEKLVEAQNTEEKNPEIESVTDSEAGPTSIFLAGKIGSGAIFAIIVAGIVVIAGVTLLVKNIRNRK